MKAMTLHQARQGFRFAKQTENKSTKTIDWYDSHLARLETWLTARSLDGEHAAAPALADLTTADLREFIGYLQGKATVYENHKYRSPIARALSPYTIRGIVATLSAFFAWCMAEGLLRTNPMARIQKPKVPKAIKERFSEDETKKLLASCDQYPTMLAARNKAIVMFLLSTGVRASELCGLRLDELDLDHGRARVTGKGAKDRYVMYGHTTTRALWHWLNQRPEASRTDRVFVTREGEPLRGDRLQKILRDLGARAGVANVHPHRFRHTAARLMLRNGADAFSVRAALGHESVQTTQLYADMEREDVERTMHRVDPVDAWGLK